MHPYPMHTWDRGALARSVREADSSSNLSRVMDDVKSMSSIRHSTLMGDSLLALSTFFSCGDDGGTSSVQMLPHTHLFTGQAHAEARLGVGRDVLFVLFLHLCRKMLEEHLVKVATAKVAVPGVRQHLQLPFFQGHDAHLG